MLADVALYFASVFIFLTIIRIAFGARRVPGIPYNQWLWWLPTGNLVELAIHFYLTGEVFDWIAYQCTRHDSPIVQLFLPSFALTKPVIMIADLHEIQDISVRRIHEIDRSHLVHGFFRLFADHATIGMKTHSAHDTSPGPQPFRQQRRLWNCMVTPRMLEQVGAPALHRAVNRMIDLWELKAQTAPGCAFSVDLDLRQAALEGMYDMLTGSSLRLFDSVEESIRTSTSNDISVDAKREKVVFGKPAKYSRLYQAFQRIFTCLDWVTTGFSPEFYTLVFEYTWILSAASKVKDEILGDMISRARTFIEKETGSINHTAHSVLEEVLLRDAEVANKTTPPISDEILKDELMELLITGHETTAAATGWALKYLADDQDVQQKLWYALAEAFPDAVQGILPSARDLMKAEVPYLDAVIAETLRISATGPVSFRETTRDCQILGHHIQAGTQIILVMGGPSYNMNGAVRLPAIRDTTSQGGEVSECKIGDSCLPLTVFAPGRWIDSAGKFDRHACLSLPFSAGPRGCFGKKIALLDMRMMIAMVILRFELPKLPLRLSRYNSRDSLTRKPICCYVKPEKRTMPFVFVTKSDYKVDEHEDSFGLSDS